MALAATGNSNEAVAHLKHALRIDPRHELSHQNLGSVLSEILPKEPGTTDVPCPLPECDGTISVGTPAEDGFIAKCNKCEAVGLQIEGNRIAHIALYRRAHGKNFPRECQIQPFRALKSGVCLLEEGNVLFKPGVNTDTIRDHDGLLDVELYEIESIPLVRVAYLVQDHPINPSVEGQLCNVLNPRVLSDIRYLKTVRSVSVHVYDHSNDYCFSKNVPVAEKAPASTGGPYAYGRLKKIELSRQTWKEYIDAMAEHVRFSTAFSHGPWITYEQACERFNIYPLTCLCEICGKQALTTSSQYRSSDGLLKAEMLKSQDAIQCTTCNIVLCVKCSATRIVLDDKGNVASPLTCAVCGNPYVSY